PSWAPSIREPRLWPVPPVSLQAVERILDAGWPIGWNGSIAVLVVQASRLQFPRGRRNACTTKDRSSMSQSQESLPSSPGKGVVWIRELFDRLAALSSAPRIGRVALCSRAVGLIAGLGAVGFLLALYVM